MNWRCRAGQVVNLIDFQKDWLDYVVTNQLKILVIQEVPNICPPPGKEVVETKDLVAFFNKPFAKMRADKPCPAGN